MAESYALDEIEDLPESYALDEIEDIDAPEAVAADAPPSTGRDMWQAMINPFLATGKRYVAANERLRELPLGIGTTPLGPGLALGKSWAEDLGIIKPRVPTQAEENIGAYEKPLHSTLAKMTSVPPNVLALLPEFMAAEVATAPAKLIPYLAKSPKLAATVRSALTWGGQAGVSQGPEAIPGAAAAGAVTAGAASALPKGTWKPVKRGVSSAVMGGVSYAQGASPEEAAAAGIMAGIMGGGNKKTGTSFPPKSWGENVLAGATKYGWPSSKRPEKMKAALTLQMAERIPPTEEGFNKHQSFVEQTGKDLGERYARASENGKRVAFMKLAKETYSEVAADIRKSHAKDAAPALEWLKSEYEALKTDSRISAVDGSTDVATVHRWRTDMMRKTDYRIGAERMSPNAEKAAILFNKKFAWKLGDSLDSQAPGLKELNSKYSAAMDLEPILARAANRDMGTFGDLGTMIGVIAGHGFGGLGGAVMGAAARAPNLRANMAFALDSLRGGPEKTSVPPMESRVYDAEVIPLDPLQLGKAPNVVNRIGTGDMGRGLPAGKLPPQIPAMNPLAGPRQLGPASSPRQGVWPPNAAVELPAESLTTMRDNARMAAIESGGEFTPAKGGLEQFVRRKGDFDARLRPASENVAAAAEEGMGVSQTPLETFVQHQARAKDMPRRAPEGLAGRVRGEDFTEGASATGVLPEFKGYLNRVAEKTNTWLRENVAEGVDPIDGIGSVGNQTAYRLRDGRTVVLDNNFADPNHAVQTVREVSGAEVTRYRPPATRATSDAYAAEVLKRAEAKNPGITKPTVAEAQKAYLEEGVDGPPPERLGQTPRGRGALERAEEARTDRGLSPKDRENMLRNQRMNEFYRTGDESVLTTEDLVEMARVKKEWGQTPKNSTEEFYNSIRNGGRR